MKKIYITFLAMSFATLGYSQVTLSSTDVNAVIGESFDYNQTDWMSPGSPGAAMTWDFSTVVTTAASSLTYTAASGSFPATNITQSGGGASVYMDQSASGQYTHGINAGGTIITYSNPSTTVEFPLNTSSNGTDAFAATFISGGFPFTRAGNTTWEVDGWGTVITPMGTYTDVLRVHITQIYTDTYSGGTINYTVDVYEWLKAGVHQAIASMTSFVYDSGSSTYGTFYSGDAGIEESHQISFNLFPNPVTEQFLITSNVNDIATVVVTDLSGKVVLEIDGQLAKETVNVSELNDGVYFVTIVLTDGTRSEPTKVVKN